MEPGGGGRGLAWGGMDGMPGREGGTGVTLWPPLAAELPTDRRRLATQLRRMMDRSGLTLAQIADRTALPARDWTAALNATAVPPRGAVEVLAQASGADYARVHALHRLAERPSGRPRPVPDPDPLDPLGPDEGLPRRRRALLATLGALAAAALAAVIMTAVPSTGRVPAADAGAPPSGPSPTAAPDPTTPASSGSPRANPPGATASSPTAPAAAHRPPTGGDTPAPELAGPPAYRSPQPPAAPPPPSVPTTGPVPVPPPAPSVPPSTPPSPQPPAPAPTPVCHGLSLLGICLG